MHGHDEAILGWDWLVSMFLVTPLDLFYYVKMESNGAVGGKNEKMSLVFRVLPQSPNGYNSCC